MTKHSIFVAVCLLVPLCGSLRAKSPIKVFILAGQSNMEGKGSVEVVNNQLKDSKKRERFAHLTEGDGWVERDDVWIDYLGAHGVRRGKLTIGYGTSKQSDRRLFGPELGFGWTIGDHFDEPVLLIKTAWGGKSLDRDFRPPSRGIPDSAAEMYRRASKNRPELTVEEFNKGYGHYYRQMVSEIAKVTKDISAIVAAESPDFEYSGFVWFQGWNDQYAPTSIEDYAENLAAFIRDVRIELNAPKLPFVIGAMGHNGDEQQGKIKQIADAQAAVAERPEFAGNVSTIRTAKYWDKEAHAAYKRFWADKKNRNPEEWRKFGNDHPYHYLGSPVFFYDTGTAFAEEMIRLIEQP